MKKQIVLVAARNLNYFLAEIPERFKDIEPITVYKTGRVETKDASYRFVIGANSLRGFHGIKFEVWGPYVDWVENALPLIRCAERP